MKRIFTLLLVCPFFLMAQETDSLKKPEKIFINDAPSNEAVYKKPRPFSFLTNIPTSTAGFTKQSFKHGNLSNLGVVVASTAILYFADQSITNTVQDKFEDSKVIARESFVPFVKVKLGGKPTNIGKIPRNINTAFYDLGQGSSAMFLAAGFYIVGKISKDNRALNTASELTQAFITLGIGTEIMKYATGRENPTDATVTRGRWRPFPKWSDFQNSKTKYDAFPSGHLATFVSAITIIGENYPEKKWIKPLGYSIAGLCGLAMINNGVHWASDFPLGIALGHGYGKYIARKARLHIVVP